MNSQMKDRTKEDPCRQRSDMAQDFQLKVNCMKTIRSSESTTRAKIEEFMDIVREVLAEDFYTDDSPFPSSDQDVTLPPVDTTVYIEFPIYGDDKGIHFIQIVTEAIRRFSKMGIDDIEAAMKYSNSKIESIFEEIDE